MKWIRVTWDEVKKHLEEYYEIEDLQLKQHTSEGDMLLYTSVDFIEGKKKEAFKELLK